MNNNPIFGDNVVILNYNNVLRLAEPAEQGGWDLVEVMQNGVKLEAIHTFDDTVVWDFKEKGRAPNEAEFLELKSAAACKKDMDHEDPKFYNELTLFKAAFPVGTKIVIANTLIPTNIDAVRFTDTVLEAGLCTATVSGLGNWCVELSSPDGTQSFFTDVENLFGVTRRYVDVVYAKEMGQLRTLTMYTKKPYMGSQTIKLSPVSNALQLYPIGAYIALHKRHLQGLPVEDCFTPLSGTNSTFVAARVIESSEEHIKISPLKGRNVEVTLKAGDNLSRDISPLKGHPDFVYSVSPSVDEIDRDYFWDWECRCPKP